ncbi:MAG: ATP synthase F1 subunit delta [Tenericutes bacterium]|nr:ATP synthase F1 subunit delta [Mycoplasmatota bacterium]
MTGIANQYALAVFSLAKQEKREIEFLTILENFTGGVDEETQKFFAHPKISKLDKKEMLEKVLQDKLLLNFLKVLVDNDRIFLVQAVALEYKNILNELNKLMNVVVISSNPLSKANLDKISKKLKSTYDRKIEIKEEIDKSIIGGFRIEFEGNIIDETINKQLEDIKSSLID